MEENEVKKVNGNSWWSRNWARLLGGCLILAILAVVLTTCTAAGAYTLWRLHPAAAPTVVEKIVVEKEVLIEVEKKVVIGKEIIAEAANRAAFTRAQIDAVLGTGNWSCFFDREDAVAVKNWPAGQIVAFPLSAVDKGVKYTLGQAVPGTGAATAWLGGTLASRAECPDPSPAPTPAAYDCKISQYGPIVYTPPAGDENVGRMVKVDAPRQFTAPLGWTFDHEGPKYLPGDTIPKGVSSAWAPKECYNKIW